MWRWALRHHGSLPAPSMGPLIWAWGSMAIKHWGAAMWSTQEFPFSPLTLPLWGHAGWEVALSHANLSWGASFPVDSKAEILATSSHIPPYRRGERGTLQGEAEALVALSPATH